MSFISFYSHILLPSGGKRGASDYLDPRQQPRQLAAPALERHRVGLWRECVLRLLCYGESAFFDYYADDLRPFFSGQWPSLFEFNMAITRKMCELLDICPNIEYTSEYIPAEKLAARHLPQHRIHQRVYPSREARCRRLHNRLARGHSPQEPPPRRRVPPKGILPGVWPQARFPAQHEHPRPAAEHGKRSHFLPLNIIRSHNLNPKIL